MTQARWDDKWIDVDIDAVRYNLEQVRQYIDEKVRLIAVLKAHAYGHGAVEIARLLYQQGVDFFAVTFLDEALRLRQAGIRSSILLFAPLINEDQIKEAVMNHLTISVSSLREAHLVDQAALSLRHSSTVHIKIDTGLGRFGMRYDEACQACQELKRNSNIYIEGIYTHMSEGAAADPRYTKRQFNDFMEAIAQLEEAGIKIPVQHCANSAVLLKYPHMHLNAVRVGTLLSGQLPAGKFSVPLKLKDPYSFKCRIIAIHNAEKGDYLGYQRTYRLKNPAQIAVLPVGYNDGLAVEVTNRPGSWLDLLKVLAKTTLGFLGWSRLHPQIIYRGNLYPIRGKVFMQLALVEFPEGLGIQVGDEVTVPIRKTLAAGNVARYYVRHGQAGKIGDESGTSYVVEEE